MVSASASSSLMAASVLTQCGALGLAHTAGRGGPVATPSSLSAGRHAPPGPLRTAVSADHIRCVTGALPRRLHVLTFAAVA
jgi:hypothetical protein